MAQAAAILSRPHIKKKAVKHTATPPMSQTVRGKRPRPSDPPDLEKPLKKKDAGQSAPTGMNGGDGSAYRKGMYLAFIDDAFAKRAKVCTSFSVLRSSHPDTGFEKIGRAIMGDTTNSSHNSEHLSHHLPLQPTQRTPHPPQLLLPHQPPQRNFAFSSTRSPM